MLYWANGIKGFNYYMFMDRDQCYGSPLDALGRPVDLEVDGGINFETAPEAVAAGADVLVAGTATFQGGSGAYGENIRRLRGTT